MTENITTEDHDDKYHITDITAAQQQSGDLRPIGELNIIERQDHRMINIDKLINDWLKKAI